MFAETDFGLTADDTLDSTSKAGVAVLAVLMAFAVVAMVLLAWSMRGAF